MAPGYWHGATNTNWSTTTNWYTTIGGPTNVTVVPGAGDTAFYNANGFTSAYNIFLNGSRSVGGINLNGNSNDVVLFGGTFTTSATQTLTLGSIGLVTTGATGNLFFNTTARIALTAANTPIVIGAGRSINIDSIVSGTGFGWNVTGNSTSILKTLNANTYTGTTSISSVWVQIGTNSSLGTGGVTLTSGKLSSSSTASFTLANALTLNGTMTLGDATNTGTLSFNGTTTIAGNTTLTVASTVNFFGVISGTNITWSIPSTGASYLYLASSSNTYSGTTAISGGLIFSNSFGSSTVSMTGGTVASPDTNVRSYTNNLTLNGTMTLGSSGAGATGALTFSGTTTIGPNPTTLTVLGAGTTLSGKLTGSAAFTKAGGDNLFLTGTTNDYTGAITVTGGNLLIAGFNSGTPNQLATAASVTLATGGYLFVNGNTAYSTFSTPIYGSTDFHVTNTSSGGVTFTGTALTNYTGSLRLYTDVTFGSATTQKLTTAVWNFGNFYFLTGGGLTGSRSQTLAYNGTPALSYGGPLFLLPQSGTGVAAKVENLSTNTLTLTNVTQNLAGSAYTTTTVEYAATNGAITQSAAIQDTVVGGVMGFIKSGTNTVTLTGDNTFKGTVSVSAGILNANSATALGSDVSSISVTSGATLSLGAAPTYATRSLTVSGTGSASAPNNGALVIANTGTSAFQSIALGSSGTYIRATNSGSINSPFTSNNNSLVLGASSSSDFIPFASLSNVFSGTGTVTYGGHSLDTGIVRADVRHTYTGNTTLAFGTTYVNSSLELPGTGGPLGNKSLTAANTLLMTGGTLSYLGGSVDYSGRFSTAGSQQWKIDVAGQTVTYAIALVGASSLSLNDTAANGSLTLSSASSTFSGGVTLTSGTLYAGAAQNGVSGPLGITGTIAFGAVGTGTLAYTSASAAFDYSSRFATSSGQNRRINANGESVTFSTAMGGDNALLLVGSAGTLTLAVANTYTQGTTISVGTLKAGNTTALGTGAVTISSNTATLQTLTASGQNGKLTVASLNNAAGGIIKIGG